MQSAVELKQIFQQGWNIPARVENYVRQAPEFTAGATHAAWRACLTDALGQGNLGQGKLGTGNACQVLDVGTGPGFFACLYSQLGHAATGLDFSERMLGVARGRAAELGVDTQFVFGDAEEPPFADASFDAISTRHVLFNLPRPGVAVREWVRMLKPGGRLILIGNEHEELEDRSAWIHPRRLLRRWSFWLRRRRMKWKPAPGYRDAVQQCPLFRHNSRTLRVVMEAVGLENIHFVDVDALAAARNSERRSRGRGIEPMRFYILVGEKSAAGNIGR
jgi:ubiquinone/menaquinone biosynthesis C-methylase UbiE